MNVKRIISIVVIFAVACVGWAILGTAQTARSTSFFRHLGAQVENLWGTPLVQQAPSLAVQIPGSEQVRWVMPSRNDIKVELETDYRKKGLIWYPTYICSFDGTYAITNTEDVTEKVRLRFDFPAKGGTYDNFAMSVDGQPLIIPINTKEGVGEIIEIVPGTSREFRVTYKTTGIRDWRYRIDKNTGQVRNLSLVVQTSFRDVDYTDDGRSPTSAELAGEGMVLKWEYTNLITDQDIGIIIPEKLNPGPLTSRITFFAPVCLIFFFVLVATINILYRIDIHPMHYLFVAAGFFAFHLLLAYLVSHINIHVSFAIAAITSVMLVTSYLRGALGKGFPLKVAVGGQLFFLVLFSYSFFLKGITGLTVAIGSVVTLAVLMRVTAHLDWNEVFSRTPRQASPPEIVAENSE